MKPLTIEEIKQLKEGDWIYIDNLKYPPEISYYRVVEVNDRYIELDSIDEKNYYCYWDNYDYIWLAYRNKEEALCKGELVELACKAGNEVYILNDLNELARPIDTGIIHNISISEVDIIYKWASYDYGYECTEVWDEGDFTAEDIGKTIFFTYEEAEQKLKKLRENNE